MTSSPPCWWTVNNTSLMIVLFICQHLFVSALLSETGCKLILLILGTDAKLNYATTKPVEKVVTATSGLKTCVDFRGQVSENGCGKWHVLV